MQNGYEPTELDHINDIYWKQHENSFYQFCYLTFRIMIMLKELQRGKT